MNAVIKQFDTARSVQSIGSPTTQAAPKELSDTAISWGWVNPPDEVLRMASESLFARKKYSGEITVEWGYLSSADCQRHLSEKPKGKKTLEWLASRDPEHVLPFKEKILALKHGFPFYDRLNLLSQHPQFANPSILKRCEEHDMALMLADGITPTLVFSNFESLITYQTRSRAQRENDPIVKLLQDKVPQLAVGSRDEISFLLKEHAQGSDADSGDTGTKVWHASAQEMQSPEAKELGRIFDHAIVNGATDIDLCTSRSGKVLVRMRKWGDLISPFASESTRGFEYSMSAEIGNKAINLLASFSNANPDGVRMREPTDGQITYKSTTSDAFFRLSFIPLNHLGESRDLRSVSIRLFSRTDSHIQMEKLNFPAAVVDFILDAIRTTQGLILFSGPVNSGKSTAIAGALGEHVRIYGNTRKRISVEDPIERFVLGVTQINVPKHLENDEDRYNVILRAIKRHDLNVLWVGEVRDKQGAEFCVGFAGSGHLVLSTIHAKDTILAYEILSNMIAPNMRFQLAESMSLSVGIRLVRTLCTTCSPKSGWSAPTEEEIRRFKKSTEMLGETEELPNLVPRANSHPHIGCGCDHGYAGTAPICEVLPFTRVVRDAAISLMSNDNVRIQRKTMAEARAQTLLQSGLDLLREGKVDLETILF